MITAVAVLVAALRTSGTIFSTVTIRLKEGYFGGTHLALPHGGECEAAQSPMLCQGDRFLSGSSLFNELRMIGFPRNLLKDNLVVVTTGFLTSRRGVLDSIGIINMVWPFFLVWQHVVRDPGSKIHVEWVVV